MIGSCDSSPRFQLPRLRSGPMAGQLLHPPLQPAVRGLRPKPAGKPVHPEFSGKEVHGTDRVDEAAGAGDGPPADFVDGGSDSGWL